MKKMRKSRIGILITHIFAQEYLKDKIIFAPIHLAVQLADGLVTHDNDVYFFTPGQINTKAKNITTDLSLLNSELKNEGCSLPEFAVNNPLAFVSVARQIQAEITKKAFEYANNGKIDALIVYMCEDEIPLYFASFVKVPVFFVHHDPFNFYRKYRVRFPRLSNLNYISLSYAQRKTAPKGLNFVANIYNGIDIAKYRYNPCGGEYFAFLGRIIQNKGVHTAINVCRETNIKLKIAGKHYSNNDDKEGSYWEKYVKPYIDGVNIEYIGFLKPPAQTSEFLSKAKALLFPVTWDEPFGMVMIESLASGTPVIAFNNGAVPEIIEDGKNGYIVKNEKEMKKAMQKIDKIDRKYCRQSVLEKFTIERMVLEYDKLIKSYLRE